MRTRCTDSRWGGRTNPLAIAALVLGVASFCGLGALTSIPAVVIGHVARRQIRRRGESGYGLAKAGLIVGYINLALFALILLIFFGSSPPPGLQG